MSDESKQKVQETSQEEKAVEETQQSVQSPVLNENDGPAPQQSELQTAPEQSHPSDEKEQPELELPHTRDKVAGIVAVAFIILFTLNFALLYASVKEVRSGVDSVMTKILSSFHQAEELSEGHWYVCPMHLFYRKKQVGDCGICGMSLVKKKTEDLEGGDEGVLHLTTRQVQLGGLIIKDVERIPLSSTIETTGHIDYAEDEVRLVTSWVSGRIDKLYVDFTGEEVKKGKALLKIYSPDLVAIQQEFLIAFDSLSRANKSGSERAINSAENLVNQAERKLSLLGVSKSQIKKLRDKRKVSDHLKINAPISGTVIHKAAFEGMYVKEGTPLFKLASLSRVWIHADIYEYEFPYVTLGQGVEINVSAYPDSIFEGKVVFIEPWVNPETRTARVRIELDNEDGRLKPDMYANVMFQSEKGQVLAVPSEAVMHAGQVDYLFIAHTGGTFEPRRVRVGPLVNGNYPVVEGVSEGDRVVVSGNFLLSSESQLSGAFRKMMEGPEMIFTEGLLKKQSEDEAICAFDGMVMKKSAFEVTVEHNGKDMLFCTRDEHNTWQEDKSGTYQAVLDETRPIISEMMEHYMNIAEALASDSLEGVSEDAQAIYQLTMNMNSIPKDHLVEGTLKNLNGFIHGTMHPAEKLGMSTDITEARERFKEMSIAIISTARLLAPEEFNNLEVYRFYCSMAPGSWYQRTPELRNPYYGSEMLECGERVIE